MLHFSLIFIAIHSVIILSQLDLYQIITYYLYSLVHSIVILNKDRGKAEHKKTQKYTQNPLDCFSVFFVNVYPWACGYPWNEYVTGYFGPG